MQGYNRLLMDGIAKLLQSEGIATYLTSGAYPLDAVAVTIGTTPDVPVKCLSLMTYPVENNDLTATTTGLQIRTRAGRDPNEVTDLTDQVYDALHNRSGFRVNGIMVVLAWYQSGAWMGQDTNKNMERVDNYYLRTERPARFSVD